jgi:type IV pilus assembly protein PilE
MLLKKLIRDGGGFSLTELLVVIVIIGVLASLALPKFLSVITKAKSTEAKLMLKQVYDLEKSHYLEKDVYSSELQAIGFDAETLVTDGGQARYKLQIEEASADGFKAVAVAVVDFDRDGVMNVWSINQDGVLQEEIPD